MEDVGGAPSMHAERARASLRGPTGLATKPTDLKVGDEEDRVRSKREE